MPLESASWVSQLDPLLPDGTDAKSEGDDHIRLIKEKLVVSFPSITGPVTVTHSQLNSVTGKANRAGDAYTGTHDFSGADVTLGSATVTGQINVPTPSSGANAASKTYVDTLAFASALPGISSATKGKTIINNGTSASWGDFPTYSARTHFFLYS